MFPGEEGKRKSSMKEFDEFDAKKRHANGRESNEIAVKMTEPCKRTLPRFREQSQ